MTIPQRSDARKRRQLLLDTAAEIFATHGYGAPLEEGNVVAIEPKLAFAGLGAVGVENSYLIGPSGPLQLTGASEEPLVV